MIKLSDRLQRMADQIKEGETMADIGTDHGFLPLSLWEQNISPKVIMCDISEPSLQKARDAARQFEHGEGLLFRAGNGLEVLECAEVDTITIAGMGGVLIRQILSEDLAKTCSFRKYVLQPRNHSGVLRHWLFTHGFRIESDQLVREGKFICEIITVVAPEVSMIKETEYDENHIFWELTDSMKSDPLFREYANRKLTREMTIKSGMLLGSEPSEADIQKVDQRIAYIEMLLK